MDGKKGLGRASAKALKFATPSNISPSGTIEDEFLVPFQSSLTGLSILLAFLPSDKSLGYYQMPLRGRNLLCPCSAPAVATGFPELGSVAAAGSFSFLGVKIPPACPASRLVGWDKRADRAQHGRERRPTNTGFHGWLAIADPLCRCPVAGPTLLTKTFGCAVGLADCWSAVQAGQDPMLEVPVPR